jgi:alpha-N-arabinofuranosidase
MPTFPEWESTVLDHVYEDVEYLSLHTYFRLFGDDIGSFLAQSVEMDAYIRTVIATCDQVRARKRSSHQVNLSFDEWNVWYHSHEPGEPVVNHEPWAIAPRVIEEPYTLVDALVVGTMLISLLRHADRVKVACIAQLVNAIAPIMTENGGGVWKQTIYYPFLHASRFGRGTVLDLQLAAPAYQTERFGQVPLLAAVATLDEEQETLTIFAVNRSLDSDLELSGDLRAFTGYAVVEHLVLDHDDPSAVNTLDRPDEVVPRTLKGATVQDGRMNVVLPKLSWNVIRLGKL